MTTRKWNGREIAAGSFFGELRLHPLGHWRWSIYERHGSGVYDVEPKRDDGRKVPTSGRADTAKEALRGCARSLLSYANTGDATAHEIAMLAALAGGAS